MSSVRQPVAAIAVAMLMAVVVLPTPPFWFAMAIVSTAHSLLSLNQSAKNGKTAYLLTMIPASSSVNECFT